MEFAGHTTFSFVDVETTGTFGTSDRVLEIGIIRVENGQIVSELNTLIDPGVYIPPEITRITGITEKDIINAPTFPDISDKVEELLADSIFVAHNARFDYSFIKHEFRRLGLRFAPKTLDTVKLSRKLYPEMQKHNLDALIKRLGINITNRHRAYDDASVLYSFFRHIKENVSPKVSEPIFTELLRSPSLPRQIDKS